MSFIETDKHRQAHPRRPEDDHRQGPGPGAGPRAILVAGRRAGSSQAHGRLPAPGGHLPPRVHPRRRAWSSRDKPLSEYLPLYRGKKDEIVTQFDMKMVEKVGLIKFDFLGLRTMTVIEDTLDLIRRQGKEALDLDTLSLDRLQGHLRPSISQGDTDGVFQVESAGMRQIPAPMLKAHLLRRCDRHAGLVPSRTARLGHGRGVHQKKAAANSRSSYPLPAARIQRSRTPTASSCTRSRS